MQVCYVVPDDAPAAMLDAVFAECYRRWGGRETLIIPVHDGAIEERYWGWARALDPDVVYSFAPLDIALLDRIDRELMPSAVELHHRHDDRFDVHFREAPEPLHALSLLPFLALNRSWGPPRSLELLTAYQGVPDPFVADSFGIADFGPGWAQAEDVLKYVETLALGDRTGDRMRSAATTDIADATALLPRLAAFAPESLTMAQVCGLGYDQHRVALEPAWDVYNIIVGDAPIDRIAFWNARIGCDPYLRKYVIALRVPDERLDDTAFRAALIDFVAQTNYPRAQNAPARVVIRSSSVAAERLQMLVEPFLHRNTHAQVEVFTDPAACAPTRQSRWAPAPTTHTGRYAESPLVLRPAPPAHLRLWPVRRAMLTAGAWANRLTFNRDDARNGTSGRLRIARRWQALFSIVTDVNAKVAHAGDLCLLITDDQKPVTLTFAESDARAIRALFPEYYFRTTTEPRVALHRERPRIRVQTSSAGRQLLGFLKKMGSLETAFAFIDDEFWRAVFDDFAGPLGGAREDELAQHAQRLRARLRGKTTFTTEDDLRLLAGELVRMAPQVRMPRTRQPFSWFVERYRLHGGDDVARILAGENPEATLRDRVSDELTALTSRAVLYAGYTWTCESCSNANFVTVDRLAAQLPCAVCAYDHAVAAQFEFRYLMDETIVRGMRERGLRSVVWALGILQATAQDAFQFSPPLDLFRDGTTELFTDLDIACVVDGRLVIGEAKDSGRQFTTAKSDQLIEAARLLHPDAIVLACPDPMAIDRVNAQATFIRDALANARIDVRAFTADLRDPGTPTQIIVRHFWTHGPARVVRAAPQPAPGPAADPAPEVPPA